MSPALLLSLTWTFIIWGITLRLSNNSARIYWLVPASFAAVFLGAPEVWHTIGAGYPHDSFWTLAWGGRIAVVAVSTLGFAGIFVILSWKTQYFQQLPTALALPLDILAGVLIYGAVYTISPQVFYTLYQQIFPGLPNQIVVTTLFDTAQLVKIAQLAQGGSLSDHLAGVGLWAILPFTLWHYRPLNILPTIK